MALVCAAVLACAANGYAVGAAVVDSKGEARAALSSEMFDGSHVFVALRKTQVAVAFGMARDLSAQAAKGEALEGKRTKARKAAAHKQAEALTGTPVAEVLRRMGISEQTFYRWKKLYGGLGVGELRRLKQLEDENRKLKQLVADLSLDKHILQDVLSKKV